MEGTPSSPDQSWQSDSSSDEDSTVIVISSDESSDVDFNTTSSASSDSDTSSMASSLNFHESDDEHSNFDSDTSVDAQHSVPESENDDEVDDDEVDEENDDEIDEENENGEPIARVIANAINVVRVEEDDVSADSDDNNVIEPPADHQAIVVPEHDEVPVVAEEVEVTAQVAGQAEASAWRAGETAANARQAVDNTVDHMANTVQRVVNAQPAVVPTPPPEPQPSTSKGGGYVSRSAKKRSASEMDSSESDDDDQRCPICLERWQGSGEHRLCSLACGHLFGMSCIERWIRKGQIGKRCPQCNKPCKKSDIRTLFASTVRVQEVREDSSVQTQLQLALKAKRELELKLMKTELENAELKKIEQMAARAPVLLQPAAGGSKIVFRLTKEIPLGEKGGGRVLNYSPFATQLAVSHASKLCGYGITRLCVERNFLAQGLEAVHGKMIRDMAYFPTENNNLLMTASLDRSGKLIDFRANLVVQTYKCSAPLWSCCWDMIGSTGHSNYVVLGMTNGFAVRFDLRKVTGEPVSHIGVRTDQTPITSIATLPSGFSASLPRGALIVAQLNTCRLYTGEQDREGTLLPFQSPFLSLRTEGVSGHMLVSTRATTGHPTIHTLYRISKEANIEPNRLFEPVMKLQGAFRQSLLSRPCLASVNNTELLVAANQEENRTVPIWSGASGGQVASLPTSDDVIDICSFSFNNLNYFGLLTDKKLSLYEYNI